MTRNRKQTITTRPAHQLKPGDRVYIETPVREGTFEIYDAVPGANGNRVAIKFLVPQADGSIQIRTTNRDAYEEMTCIEG